MTRDGEDKNWKEQLWFTALFAAWVSSSDLKSSSSLQTILAASAMAHNLSTSLVSLLISWNTFLHNVLLRPSSITLPLSSNSVCLAVRTVACKVSVRVTRLTDSVVVGDWRLSPWLYITALEAFTLWTHIVGMAIASFKGNAGMAAPCQVLIAGSLLSPTVSGWCS